MIINNLKLVNRAFDLLKEEEAKINYYYEPRFFKKNKKWKRHLNFYELKKDFMKDRVDYGFCPYIEFTCEEQMKNKNIMKFYKQKKNDYSNYIKKLNYFFMHTKDDSNKKTIKNTISRGIKKKNQVKIKKIPKIKDYNNKSLLNNLYSSIYGTNIKDDKRKINSANNLLNYKIKDKKITKIVKFSREDIIDYRLLKKDYLIKNDINNSFSFESKEEIKNNNKEYYSLCPNNFYDKKDNFYKNKSIMRRRGKSMVSNAKMSSFYTSHILNNSTINKYDKTPIHKINTIKSHKNSCFIRKNILNSSKINISNSNTLSQSKKGFNTIIINKIDYSNDKKNIKCNQKNNSIEKLENYSGGIFKNAVKYDYLTKKYKNIK